MFSGGESKMKKIMRQISAAYGSTPTDVKNEIQNAINIAWNDPNGQAELQKLFPEGKPSPEQFIKRTAAQIRMQMSGICSKM